IEWQDKSSNGKPEAQKILAQNMTRFVHGESGLLSAERITQALFTNSLEKLSYSELKQLELDGIPSIESTQQDIVELLVESGLAKSKRIARELIEDNAISVNGEKITPDNSLLGFPLFDQYWLIKRGKKHFGLVKRK
ncbi:tyrosine--tRNA ligase, partial [Vibrio anguillarum]|nr:tyrosine--tRNA ligase [Vibrio anguillarum]